MCDMRAYAIVDDPYAFILVAKSCVHLIPLGWREVRGHFQRRRAGESSFRAPRDAHRSSSRAAAYNERPLQGTALLAQPRQEGIRTVDSLHSAETIVVTAIAME